MPQKVRVCSIRLTKRIPFLDKHCFFLTIFFHIYIQKIVLKMTVWSSVSLNHWDRDKPFCKERINKGTTNVNFCYIRRKAKIIPNCLDTVKLLQRRKTFHQKTLQLLSVHWQVNFSMLWSSLPMLRLIKNTKLSNKHVGNMLFFPESKKECFKFVFIETVIWKHR